MDHSLFERGRGNVCSVEVSCIVARIKQSLDLHAVVQLPLPVARNDVGSRRAMDRAAHEQDLPR